MIRWYDILAAVFFAYGILHFLVSVPVLGAAMAYGIYWGWTDYYCPMRKEQEYGE